MAAGRQHDSIHGVVESMLANRCLRMESVEQMQAMMISDRVDSEGIMDLVVSRLSAMDARNAAHLRVHPVVGQWR